jgi:hypothetical protein
MLDPDIGRLDDDDDSELWSELYPGVVGEVPNRLKQDILV